MSGKVRSVTVTAPARLHLGFLDLHGGLGRQFGSVGVAVEGFHTRLRVSGAETTSVAGAEERNRTLVILGRLAETWPLPPVRVEILETIPAHSGLGSGTQLGLALGVAVARLLGRGEDARAVAKRLERGARSGIGLGAFLTGGFLVDGGRGPGDEPPPIISRLVFPATWRLLLILDENGRGLSGEAERTAFRHLPPFPSAAAADLCRLTLMRLLPAIAEADLAAAGLAIGELQRVVGDYFAPAQGARFTSPTVAELLGWIEDQGFVGVGQSSWGPTGFALLPDEATAQRLRQEIESRAGSGLRLVVVAGRNRGAEITP